MIHQAADGLGLSGRPLCLHTSLRSFGEPLENGALTVIEGLLDAGCTVMAPTFCDEPETMPPADVEVPLQNGWTERDTARTRAHQPQPYAPETAMINKHMGALPRALLTIPGRKRSRHPLDSFAAVGPMATELIEGQTRTDVYAPFRALIEAEGAVLLIGVGLDRMTLIHHGEYLAGRRLLRRWAMDQSGEIVETHIGSCSEGFPRLEPYLGPLSRQATVGASQWRAFPAGETAQRVRDIIRDQPDITHCGRPGCQICDDMLLGGPIIEQGSSS